MERKLVKQGVNALTVTLPVEWLRIKGLSAGDCVNLEFDQDVTITAQKTTPNTSCTVDIRSCAREVSFILVFAKYVEGFDIITVLHDNSKLARQIGQEMLGMLIEEHTDSRMVVKSLVSVAENNIMKVIRRSSHILLEQARLLSEFAAGKCSFDDVKSEEKLLDLNIFYCLRYLNKYEANKQSYRYFLLCANLESAGDIISNIAIYGQNKKLAKDVHLLVEQYNRLLFEGNVKKLYLILKEFRQTIPKTSFANGLAYELAEVLGNFIGYLIAKD